MVDAAVSKTVEGQPHVGSTPTFGTTDIWQYAPGYHPWGIGSGSIDDIDSRAPSPADPCKALFLRKGDSPALQVEVGDG